jgi:hypothetical protein
MRSVWKVAIAAMVLLALGMPSARASSVDLTVYRVRSLVGGQESTTVRDQEQVTFRAFGRNAGPGANDLFVTYSNTRRLYIANEVCIVPASESGDFNNASADTPSCEWSSVPEGDSAIVRVTAYAVGQPGQHVRITFCASDGTGTDVDPSNDCRTKRLTIAAS